MLITISIIFLFYIPKQKASNKYKTVMHIAIIIVYSGVLCGQWKLYVLYFLTDIQTIEHRNMLLEKKLPGFHCTYMNKTYNLIKVEKRQRSSKEFSSTKLIRPLALLGISCEARQS
jgi:hypothetical protein